MGVTGSKMGEIEQVELEESKRARSAEMAEAEPRSEAKAVRGRRRKCWAVGGNRESEFCRLRWRGRNPFLFQTTDRSCSFVDH